MRVLDGAEQVAENRDDLRQGQATFQTVGQGAPRDKRHDDVGDLARLAEVVDREDVRMVELGGEGCLLLEAGQEVLIVQKVGGQHLDGDLTPQRRVVRHVDEGHAAAANALDDLVLAQALPFERGDAGRLHGRLYPSVYTSGALAQIGDG